MMQVLIALDQVANTLLGGWAVETISARAWRMSARSEAWRYTRIVIDLIFFFDKDHCRESYLSEEVRAHLPVEYRDGRKRT